MANGSLVRFVVVEQQSNSVIGTIWHAKAVPYFNAREIGYTLSNEYRGQGIGTEAVRLLVHHLFSSTLLNRLEIRMDTRNQASETSAPTRRCAWNRAACPSTHGTTIGRKPRPTN
jgi:ribosomal-protein-alanine N-acetyltransferase